MQRSLAEYLEYLGGVGFTDLYLRPGPTPDGNRSTAAEPGPGPEVEAGHPPEASIAEPPAGSAIDLAALAIEAESCKACQLCQKRQRAVFGTGDPEARLMFIGEAPGAEEDRQGLPFVGPAGELLTRIIEAIDLRRDQVYIANMVKCRPPNNRDPLPAEVAACSRFLDLQIDRVAPTVIVALGRVAAQNLLQSTESLGRLRGRWHSIRGIRTRVTYHPAALLRNRQWKRPTWEDMQLVRDALRGA